MKMKRAGVIFALLLATGLVPSLVRAQAVAVVVDVSGQASAGVLDYLNNQSELHLGKAAVLQLVYLNTSKTWTFNGPGVYVLATEGPQVKQGAAPKLMKKASGAAGTLAAMAPAHRERLALGAVVMRSNGDLRLTGPVDQPVISAQPLLLWEGQGPYRVEVTELGTGKLMARADTTAAYFELPIRLPAGRYSWQVEQAGEKPASKKAQFEVLGVKDKKTVGLRAQPSTFSGRVELAAQLEQAGYTHDALVLWRALSNERPDHPGLKAWAR